MGTHTTQAPCCALHVAEGNALSLCFWISTPSGRRATHVKHLLATTSSRSSSYSSFVIRTSFIVGREPSMEPPTHAAYFRCESEMTETVAPSVANADTSFCIRSPIPGSMEDPPESTTFSNI